MPVNRNALIRYKTIDQCLRNRRRRWTLEDLIEKVSEALYEYEGMDKGISRRTIQADIQVMRSDKLGYNAPIVILEKKFYVYDDASYSITNIPLNETDLSRMTEAVEVLKQFKGFSHFKDLGEVVQKLEGHVYASGNDQRTVIDFEKNDGLKGLPFLDVIYEALTKQKVLQITYRSFKARQASSFVFHVWWLKEFKNRWFAVGRKNNEGEILSLAVDRMLEVGIDNSAYYMKKESGLTPELYYKDVIGVTVSRNIRPARIQLLISHKHAPYVLTKPLHPSQHEVRRDMHGVVIQLYVQHNQELEKEILGFGEGVKVLWPQKLRNCIRKRLEEAIKSYDLVSAEMDAALENPLVMEMID
ncbi:MAG: WYL domain-containing protein [Sphingobacteriales bacterium]|nr:MAG: WYL domain-containing protein [Sphingobacteriales bacterium]